MSDDEFPKVIETIPCVYDPLLQVLANVIHGGEESSFSMTVIAGGQLVTGDVLHRNAWLGKLQALMPHDAARVMIETLELEVRQWEVEQAEANPDSIRSGWLHFDDAEVAGSPVGLLRVALPSVTAWSIGYLRRELTA